MTRHPDARITRARSEAFGLAMRAGYPQSDARDYADAAERRERRALNPDPETAHDLAADWSWMTDDVDGFTIGRGRVVWNTAAYADTAVRVERFDPLHGRRVRYVSPDERVTLVRLA